MRLLSRACSNLWRVQRPSWWILRQLQHRWRAETPGSTQRRRFLCFLIAFLRGLILAAMLCITVLHDHTTFRRPMKRALLCSTPYVTGTSVLGITYRDGVLLAADTLGAASGPSQSGNTYDDRVMFWQWVI